MFAKHLPPSAALLVVLALDPQAEAACDPERVALAAADASPVDVVYATHWPEQLNDLRERLRPGGRLILSLADLPNDLATGEARLTALQAAGYIHCLIEAWGLPLIVNPAFEDWRNAAPGPRLQVDPAQALASEE